jgi:hypothetical protein
VPSYSTIRRYLRAQGLDKRRRVTSRRTAGALIAEAKLASRASRRLKQLPTSASKKPYRESGSGSPSNIFEGDPPAQYVSLLSLDALGEDFCDSDDVARLKGLLLWLAWDC